MSHCNLSSGFREASTATITGECGGCRAPGSLCLPATACGELSLHLRSRFMSPMKIKNLLFFLLGGCFPTETSLMGLNL